MPLHAFVVRDTNVSYEEDEVWSIALWAESHDEAKKLAWEKYPHRNEDGATSDCLEFTLHQYNSIFKHTPEFSGEEKRPEVLRILGYRNDEEYPCYGCEMAACGIAEFKVCDECGYCNECGHNEDCIGVSQ